MIEVPRSLADSHTRGTLDIKDFEGCAHADKRLRTDFEILANIYGAGDRVRTGDVQLGYLRVDCILASTTGNTDPWSFSNLPPLLPQHGLDGVEMADMFFQIGRAHV